MTESESPYTSFLEGKSVEFEDESVIPEISERWTSDSLAQIVQKCMLSDKDLIDKSQEAFVSFIRYYKEHQLQFIFAFNALNIGQVANSFFLFKLPRVKEILGRAIRDFTARNDVNFEQIGYKDANKGK